jgi:hypothetical protein
LIHERHEFIRESRHRATDADAAYVWTSADAAHPAALSDVAVHYGTPAADLYQAFRGAVFVREIALLVITGAIATFVNRFAK